MLIKSALKLVSDAHAPAVFSLSTFESGTRAEESTRKAHATTRDRATNPFIHLYESVLIPGENWQDYNVVGISIVGISQIIPGLTLARLLKEKFPHLQACCVHRSGLLEIGDCAVWVGVAAPHRDEAFKACRYIIDQIKLRLPIWKKEHYVDGDSG